MALACLGQLGHRSGLPRTRRRLAAIAILALILVLALVIAASARELIPGVWTVDFGYCALDWYAASGSVGLACRGVDYARVWPLPIVQPWAGPGHSDQGRNT